MTARRVNGAIYAREGQLRISIAVAVGLSKAILVTHLKGSVAATAHVGRRLSASQRGVWKAGAYVAERESASDGIDKV